MAKYFELINAKDTDEVSWKGKEGKVTVNLALVEGNKWMPCLKSKSGRSFVVREEPTQAKKDA